MSNNKITGLPDPTSDAEPVTKSYADANYSGGGGGTGRQGPQGTKGDKGDTGSQGSKGDKGDTGSQGLKGDKGDTGSQGSKGDKGDTGSQGSKGDTGSQGPQGPSGSGGSGGLSVTGFTMQGDINMSANKITNLPAPTSDTEPATKKYSDDKFAEKTDVLTSHGFVMKDGINMGGFSITNLPIPTLDSEPATKKWVTDDFTTKTEILNGFTMNGILDLGGHSIIDVHVPNDRDDAVTTKKYCNDNFLSNTTGFTMQGDINMSTNKITGLPFPTLTSEPATKSYVDTHYLPLSDAITASGFRMLGEVDMGANKIHHLLAPTTDSEPVTKLYAENNFLPKNTDFNIGTYRIETSANPTSDNGIINRGYVDARYVRKTKLTTADWTWGYQGTGSTYKYPYRRDTGWPVSVRTDELTNDSNIVLRHITLDNE